MDQRVQSPVQAPMASGLHHYSTIEDLKLLAHSGVISLNAATCSLARVGCRPGGSQVQLALAQRPGAAPQASALHTTHARPHRFPGPRPAAGIGRPGCCPVDLWFKSVTRDGVWTSPR
jgi:hypothetical protein